MSMPLAAQPHRIVPMVLVVMAALIAIAGWDVLVGYYLYDMNPALGSSELRVFLLTKGSFALALALFFCWHRGWARHGFAGGLSWRYWPALLPIWLTAAVSAIQGIDGTTDGILGWFAVSLAIGFGEEGIFRGVILSAIRQGSGSDRWAIMGSAGVFGLAHLSAVTALDPRIVVGQAAFAAGIGLALGWVRLAAGSLWPCIIAHSALDFFGIATSGGVTEAMQYSPTNFLYELGMAGFAILWGAMLLGRPYRPLFGFARQ
jgi:membrane protease YdiL (CAAX protease family)